MTSLMASDIIKRIIKILLKKERERKERKEVIAEKKKDILIKQNDNKIQLEEIEILYYLR